MHLSKKIASALAVSALGISTLIAAPAAYAAASPSTIYVRCQSGAIAAFSDASRTSAVTGISTDPGDSLTVVFQTGDSSTVDASTPTATTCNNVNYEYDQDASGPVQVNATSSNQTVNLTLSATEFPQDLFVQMHGTLAGALALPITYSGSGPTPTPSSDSAAAAPQTFELSITPTDGTTCANSSESGRAGTWMTLPAANDCTAPESTPNAALLGWATIPNFPVDIAQRQVDNGWGAYEIFNEEGQLTAVFIPAGMPTFLSAPGKIYPIWKM